MRDKIGEVFKGKISAVTSFGVFVLLDDVYVEGLVHISELGKDYFHFKKDIQAIVGEKSGMQYRLGDTLTVKVMSANLESAQVDFALIKEGDVRSTAPSIPARSAGARPGSSPRGAAPKVVEAKPAALPAAPRDEAGVLFKVSR